MTNKSKSAAKDAVTETMAETLAAPGAQTEAAQSTAAPEQPPVTEQPPVAMAVAVTEPAVAKAAKVKFPVSRLVVIVKGPAKGRWRAGRHFTPEPVTIPLDDLTEDQKAALSGDPELTVIVTEA